VLGIVFGLGLPCWCNGGVVNRESLGTAGITDVFTIKALLSARHNGWIHSSSDITSLAGP